ncbi:hypothetical protein AVEN_214402-1 [Araneus ventricosus]|uniref:Uncharacterized protein n=1 Tax=Araneus ventricosus TaxID=182803 RepID=A0A4Y2MAJ0_ARAVE|nr:hypothetical protein AVEN_214402-1 [Araneus ventricosus]
MQVTKVGICQRGVQTLATFPGILQWNAMTEGASLAKGWLKFHGVKTPVNKVQNSSVEVLTFKLHQSSDLESDLRLHFLNFHFQPPKELPKNSISVICPAADHILQPEAFTSLPGSLLERVET